jgi:hypothetical protein
MPGARYTEDRVRKEVERLYASGAWDGVRKILDGYQGREPWRVWLACVMLSEGKIGKLRHYVDVARKDYRDVLYWTRLPPEDDE